MPDEKALFVAEIVKFLLLVDAAAPETDHVHPSLSGGGKQVVVKRAISFGDEAVRGNPIGALGEDRLAVDDELERFTERVGMPVEHDRPQSDPFFPEIDHAAPHEQFQAHVVKGLIAVAVRPPKSRRGNFRRKS